MLEELDLFAYREITVNGEQTNALLESLMLGIECLINYSFFDGFINVRSILRIVNKFEIHNELS